MYFTILFCFSLFLLVCVFWRFVFCGEVGGTTLPRREVGGVSTCMCPLPTDDRGSSEEMGFKMP